MEKSHRAARISRQTLEAESLTSARHSIRKNIGAPFQKGWLAAPPAVLADESKNLNLPFEIARRFCHGCSPGLAFIWEEKIDGPAAGSQSRAGLLRRAGLVVSGVKAVAPATNQAMNIDVLRAEGK
jgi:ABC-type sulfate transport system substrate-binding protein